MHGVLTLERTIFFLFQTFRSVALFFRRRIVATFALGALHDYQFTSHFSTLLFKIDLLRHYPGPERMVMISDSISAAGLPAGKYTSGGLAIVVNDGDVVARLEDGTIPGSNWRN